jgi:RNA polymerase sigma factor (sigma-70 family)
MGDPTGTGLIGLKQRTEIGDDTALEDLLTRLYAPVTGFLRRRFGGGDTDISEWIDDLVQETLMKVTQHLKECSATSDAQLMGWVLSIARHVAINWLRSCAISRNGIKPIATEVLAHDHVHPGPFLTESSASTMDDIILRAVNAIHDELPEQTQYLLWLRIVRDASWPDIGREIRTTPSAAKRRWQRALGRFRREIVRRVDELPGGSRPPLLAMLRRLGIER